jgi:drug/metabolite transporter (DMT)-like permease
VLVAGFERGHLAGLGVALLGALFAAIFPLLNRRLVRQGGLDPLVMTTWEMVGACLVCLVAMPWLDGPGAYGRMFEFHGRDGLWLLLLAWPCTIFAYAFYIHILRYLSAYTANLAANFEPVYGILAAAVLFGEHRQLHAGFFAGTSTILLANILHPLILRRLARRKAVETV